MDISQHIKSKSDQLNADDLTGGVITVCVERVTKGTSEQPVVVHLRGGHQPLKPCKTVMRILSHAWGVEADAWSGRWMRLYRDPAVRFGSDTVGGIRVDGLSHIERDFTISLNVSRGKKAAYRVEALRDPTQTGAPTATLDAVLDSHGLTRSQVDLWLVANGKTSLTNGDPAKEPALAVWLAADATRIEAVRVAS